MYRNFVLKNSYSITKLRKNFFKVDPKNPDEANMNNANQDVTEDKEDYTEQEKVEMETAATVVTVADPTTTTEMVITDTLGPSTTEVTLAPSNLQSLVANTMAPGGGISARFKGWLTWAYFYGSLAGTLFGFIICGVIFYFCRRTVYSNWYRGMYKRYGCDASGSTGGATGADFGSTTTGGNTTIGSTTAGATTSTIADTSTSNNTTSTVGTETKSMITM